LGASFETNRIEGRPMNALSTQKRWWLWLPLLGFAAWLAFFGDKTPNATSDTVNARSPIERSPSSNTSPSQRAETPSNSSAKRDLEVLLARDQLYPSSKSKAAINDLFASSSWTPPPPPRATLPALPPPAPTAPALPFTYVGKKLEGAVWEVYVARGEQSFVLRTGTVIENTYRVQSVAPPSLSLIYLPLGQTQTLAIGESQ
jgi:hypothetical protein